MIILAIADLHDWSVDELELIRELEYDCCCLLGDIPDAALKIIKRLVQKPLFGVLGNHDEPSTLSRCGIQNLDGKSVTVNGVTIAGFGGSHRYKNGDYPMLTQRESIIAAKLCPKADILISHDTVYHAMERLDNAHCGLKGISKYIVKNKPGLNICGHYHISDSKRRLYKGCDILCVYRCALVKFPENTTEIIF
ncbi:MAG: metallophosphoesterase family protein [Oscillospiraceae bacterium]|nr:metallophosphoesterase family protein [Oscillospiraceae bacterium]